MTANRSGDAVRREEEQQSATSATVDDVLTAAARTASSPPRTPEHVLAAFRAARDEHALSLPTRPVDDWRAAEPRGADAGSEPAPVLSSVAYCWAAWPWPPEQFPRPPRSPPRHLQVRHRPRHLSPRHLRPNPRAELNHPLHRPGTTNAPLNDRPQQRTRRPTAAPMGNRHRQTPLPTAPYGSAWRKRRAAPPRWPRTAPQCWPDRRGRLWTHHPR